MRNNAVRTGSVAWLASELVHNAPSAFATVALELVCIDACETEAQHVTSKLGDPFPGQADVRNFLTVHQLYNWLEHVLWWVESLVSRVISVQRF